MEILESVIWQKKTVADKCQPQVELIFETSSVMIETS